MCHLKMASGTALTAKLNMMNTLKFLWLLRLKIRFRWSVAISQNNRRDPTKYRGTWRINKPVTVTSTSIVENVDEKQKKIHWISTNPWQWTSLTETPLFMGHLCSESAQHMRKATSFSLIIHDFYRSTGIWSFYHFLFCASLTDGVCWETKTPWNRQHLPATG